MGGKLLIYIHGWMDGQKRKRTRAERSCVVDLDSAASLQADLPYVTGRSLKN